MARRRCWGALMIPVGNLSEGGRGSSWTGKLKHCVVFPPYDPHGHLSRHTPSARSAHAVTPRACVRQTARSPASSGSLRPRATASQGTVWFLCGFCAVAEGCALGWQRARLVGALLQVRQGRALPLSVLRLSGGSVGQPGRSSPHHLFPRAPPSAAFLASPEARASLRVRAGRGSLGFCLAGLGSGPRVAFSGARL